MNVWNHTNGCDCATRMTDGAATAAFPAEPTDENGDLINPSPDPTVAEGWSVDASDGSLMYTNADGYITRVMSPSSPQYQDIKDELDRAAGIEPPTVAPGQPFTEAPEISLDTDKSGYTHLVDAISEEMPREPGSPFTRTTMHIAGQPHIKQRTLIAKEAYLADQGEAERARIDALLESDQPITVLTVGENGSVTAQEGRYFKAGRGWSVPEGTPLMIEKGKRTHGKTFRPERVLDAAPGYGKAAVLGTRFAETMAATSPALKKIPGDNNATRFRDVPDWDGDSEPPSAIAAVYVIDNPDFNGGKANGCMFMATDVQRSDEPGGRDIVNGYFYAPNEAPSLTSETSSMYADDLARRGGQIRDYRAGSMNIRECWEKLPSDRTGAFRHIVNARATKPAPAPAPKAASVAAAPAPAGWGAADPNELPF